MLFEALSCPIPAVTSRAVWVHRAPGAPETLQGSKRPSKLTRILCLVKNLQIVQGELLFPGSSDPYLHPSSPSCFLRHSQSLCSELAGDSTVALGQPCCSSCPVSLEAILRLISLVPLEPPFPAGKAWTSTVSPLCLARVCHLPAPRHTAFVHSDGRMLAHSAAAGSRYSPLSVAICDAPSPRGTAGAAARTDAFHTRVKAQGNPAGIHTTCAWPGGAGAGLRMAQGQAGTPCWGWGEPAHGGWGSVSILPWPALSLNGC